MFKLQCQNPYMRVNNQLVYPFTRQLPTEFFLIELLSGHFLPANEHQPEQHKVDGNGYQHHENRRKPLARAQPKEKVEQSYLQKIVQQVATGKACGVALRGFAFESEVGGQSVIANQAHDIAGRIGKVGLGDEQTQAIDAVMNGRTDRSGDAETEQSPEVFLPTQPKSFDKSGHSGLLLQYLTDVIKRALLHFLIDFADVKAHGSDRNHQHSADKPHAEYE